jgi:ABC-type branched-subunit amino acid transport system substrate-binding protein
VEDEAMRLSNGIRVGNGRRWSAALAATAATAVLVTACGSSSGGGGASGGSTIKVGLLTSLSGPYASTMAGTLKAVNARLSAYRAGGGKCATTKIDVVTADDQSSAQGALSGTQKLIQQDKVYAVLGTSSFFYGASQFATTVGKKTPIFGIPFDGSPQWLQSDNNMFPAGPVTNFTESFSTTGQFLKTSGATRIAGVGYAGPSSAAALRSIMKSATAAGLSQAYVNTNVTPGSTDVGAIVLGIIHSKADGVLLTMAPDTSLAIVGGLKQAGYQTKAIITPTGYGADLLKSQPAVQAAQGVTFETGWAPNELNTPGTKVMSSALKQYAGSATGIPGLADSYGWLTTDLFLHALDLAGCDASQADLMAKTRADKSWTANGLLPQPIDFASVPYTRQCLYFSTLKGAEFVPVPDATPVCGAKIG